MAQGKDEEGGGNKEGTRYEAEYVFRAEERDDANAAVDEGRDFVDGPG